ncbi:MAG: TrmO family methyltransferase [Treponemataceae bacterium]
MNERMELRKIGTVRRTENEVQIEIDTPYRAGLAGLDEFSHCHILWWAGSDFGMGFDTRTVIEGDLPYAPGRRSGVFANRSPFRPNLIAMTICPIKRLDVDKGILEPSAIDALDGTVVLDIKPYYGCCDRVKSPRTPSWLPPWGEWIPEGGIDLEG